MVNSKSPIQAENPAGFCLRKLKLALAIMGAGILFALAWDLVQGWAFSRPYPANTFLFLPKFRFGDFTDLVIDGTRANPYQDPCAPYMPFAWVFFRAASSLPYFVSLTGLFFVSLGGLFLLLDTVLAKTVVSPWTRMAISLLFLMISYPVLFCIDRGNIEIFIALLVALSLFFLSRARYGMGLLCLLPAASFKIYPALFLLLYLRQRKIKSIAMVVVALPVILLLSMAVLALPVTEGLATYGRNVVFLNRIYIMENYTLEGSASLWNAYKVGLISATHFGLMTPVDFSFDGTFIRTSYSIYSAGSALLAVVLAVQVCLLEKEVFRCAAFLLLQLSVATPYGADYRLLYTDIALVLMVLIKTRRPHDLLIVVLLALALVPKKEIILDYAGFSESGFADISLQVVLNPLLIFTALGLLFYDSCVRVDWAWGRLRGNNLWRAFIPSLPS